MKIKKWLKQVVLWTVAVSILLPCVFNILAINIDTLPDDIIKSDELISIPTNDKLSYSDTEVIVLLDETKLSSDVQFCSLYSDDYVSINNEVNSLCSTRGISNIKLADSTSKIKSLLNLDVDFSEMKLLNPSTDDNLNGLYNIQEHCNNIFSIILQFLQNIICSYILAII